MSKKGWHLNALAGPPAVHIAVTVCRLVPVPKYDTDHCRRCLLPVHMARSCPVLIPLLFLVSPNRVFWQFGRLQT